ncbi:MAG TPA: EamA family transporter [Methylomirabilota bacterium]|nr:EamA family transporter [Methylomirabilota bacterium]
MLLGLLLISLASISWGTTGATMTLLARDAGMGPFVVGWSRLAIAAPALVGTAVVAKMLQPRHPAGGAARLGLVVAGLTSRDLGAWLILGLAMAAYQAFYFWAVTLTGVAVAALLAICSAPLMIAFLAALFLKERVTLVVLVSLGMALAGTVLLVVGPHALPQISGHFRLGALLALGAGLSYAVYAVTAKGLLRRAAPLTVSAATFTLAALFLAPLALGAGGGPGTLGAPSPILGGTLPALYLMLYLGLGPTAAAYALFTVGLRRVPATAAGIVTLLEPLTATLLGVFAFGESLGATGLAGGGLLLGAIALLTLVRP